MTETEQAWLGQTWLDGAGALLVAFICTIATGGPGFVAGGVLFAAWYALPTLYTAAFGQILVVALFADGVGAVYLIPLELGLLAVLVGPLLRADRPRWRVLVTSLVAVGFGVGVLGSHRWSGEYWLTIGVALTAVAVVAYGMHRYERVALGLVKDTHE
ncbi:hypothetical protein [Haladaptatus sp. DFWS20]|uniref:hypothetical protein n=1 Tax=Haladaptatus sp. DFWS20 TaxID=3403467 RepID=UPI003EBC967B